MAPHAGGQQARRKRPRPQEQQPPPPPHFVYTLFPGTASLEAYLTPYVLQRAD